MVSLLSQYLTVIAGFGLLPVYRSLPVTRHDFKAAHDTVQLFSYHLQKKSGRFFGISGPQLPQKNGPHEKPVSWTVFRALFKEENWKFWLILGNNEFSEKGRLEGTIGKFCDFISEKGCLEGTSEIFEKNKVQRENGLYHRTAPCNLIR